MWGAYSTVPHAVAPGGPPGLDPARRAPRFHPPVTSGCASVLPMPPSRVIVPFPEPSTAVTAVRGTLLGSSLQAMRDRRLEARYFARLPPPHHDAIRSLVAMAWIDVDVALAHYRVMGELFPDPVEQRQIGRAVGDRVQKSYLATVIRALRATGLVTPLAVVTRMPAIWSRVFSGGGVQLVELGPTEFEVESRGCALFTESYFGRGWEGVWEASLQLVTPSIRIERGRRTGEDGYLLVVSWRS